MCQGSQTPKVNQPVPTVEVTGDHEPNILLDEVRETVNVIKKREAPCCNGIEAELWQAVGENGIKVLHRFCTVMWQSCK